MSPQTLFVALQPDAHLTSLLLAAKSNLQDVVGPQLYLDHPPHLTVYLAAFSSSSAVASCIAELALRLVHPTVELLGWKVFEQDVLTGNNTLVCEISAQSQSYLRRLQSDIVQTLSPLRCAATSCARYDASRSHLSTERLRAIDECGFPFIGEDWQPHFTVASVSQAIWPVAWDAMKSRPICGAFSCPELKLYRLDNGSPRAINAWQLSAA